MYFQRKAQSNAGCYSLERSHCHGVFSLTDEKSKSNHPFRVEVFMHCGHQKLFALPRFDNINSTQPSLAEIVA